MLFLGGVGNAEATLFDRGNGLIYDDVLDITWLQDADYSKTSVYSSNGMMTWYDATAWADQLEYYERKDPPATKSQAWTRRDCFLEVSKKRA